MGRFENAEHWLGIAERAAQQVESAQRRARLLGQAAHQRAMNALARADTADAVHWAQRAVDVLSDDGEALPVAQFFLGIALFWSGERGEAERLLRGYLAETPAGDQDVRRYFAMALIAEACALRGELEEADALVDAALSVARERGLEEHPPTEQVHVVTGILALTRDAVEVAEERFERAVALARRGGDRIEVAHALLWLGNARARHADPDGAREALDRARDELRGNTVPGLAELVAELARGLDEPARPHTAVDDEPLTDAEVRVLAPAADGPDLPRHRPRAVSLAQHGAHARRAHPAQARRLHARRGGQPGARARAALTAQTSAERDTMSAAWSSPKPRSASTSAGSRRARGDWASCALNRSAASGSAPGPSSR